jgi:putative oxidoreductase
MCPPFHAGKSAARDKKGIRALPGDIVWNVNLAERVINKERSTLRRLITFSFIGADTNTGLLVLRVLTCSCLFMKHGYEKVFTFSEMAQYFFDPLHIGHVPSLIIATVSDGFCSLLILFGLATRWACIYVFCDIFIAWALCHHFIFWGRMVGDHGELIVLYLIFLIGIFIAGPGSYSLDAWLERKP